MHYLRVLSSILCIFNSCIVPTYAYGNQEIALSRNIVNNYQVPITNIKSRFIKKKSILKRSEGKHIRYQLSKEKHFNNPQEAMSLEIDSALVGFMHETSPATATGLSTMASMFALGSSILGLYCIYKSYKDTGKAETLMQQVDLKLVELEAELENTSASNELKKIEIKQTQVFFLQLKKKLSTYINKENSSIKINSMISLGTFSEFLGFICNSSMLGSQNLFPALASASHYFLAGGLLVVSTSSLWEAGKEVKNLWKVNSLRIPGLDRELMIIPKVLHDVFISHEDEFILELSDHSVGSLYKNSTKISEESFRDNLSQAYVKAIKKRIRQRTAHSSLKGSARLLLGLGTGILAIDQITLLAGIVFLPAIGLTVTGIGTGIGVGLGIIEYIYYIKFIKTSPKVEVECLNTDDIEIIRVEIFSLLLKLMQHMPENSNFDELFQFYQKLAPIDDFDHSLSDPKQVTFFAKKTQKNTETTLRIIASLAQKGLLKETMKPVFAEIFDHHQSRIFLPWEPYITWDFCEKQGDIHWNSLVADAFTKEEPKARSFMTTFFESAINTELKSLEDELKLTIDQLVKTLKKDKNRQKAIA